MKINHFRGDLSDFRPKRQHWLGLCSNIRRSRRLALQENAVAKSMFPEVGKSWSAFNSIKKLMSKTGNSYVKEVMTVNPYVVHPDTSMDEASRLLLLKRVRRLPVVDADGKLVGVISRGNIIRAVLSQHMSAKQEKWAETPDNI